MNILPSRVNLPTLDGYYAWSRLVTKGYFMKGTIKSASGAVCLKCSSVKFKNSYDDIVGYSIPRCIECQALPSKLRVARVLPDRHGNGKEITLYRNLKDEPLTKISDALALLGSITDELIKGTYRPEKYSHKEKAVFRFSKFADTFSEHSLSRTKLPQEHDEFLTPGGYRRRMTLISLHLKPYFKETSIQDISKYTINEFHRSWIDRFRTRDLSVSELRTMLIFAKDQMGLISEIPVFPKIKRSKEKTSEEIPTTEVQARIILNIDNIQYREMWMLIACFAKRSCEGRAWQVRDWDSENKILKTQRHFSKGGKGFGEVLLDGRKSIKKSEKKGIEYDYPDHFLSEILDRHSKGKNPEQFIFNGKIKPFVNIETLNEAWNRSAKKLGLDINPYVGTKHATLTAILGQTGSLGRTKNYSGHTSDLTLQRYAQERTNDKRDLVNSERFREIDR